MQQLAHVTSFARTRADSGAVDPKAPLAHIHPGLSTVALYTAYAIFWLHFGLRPISVMFSRSFKIAARTVHAGSIRKTTGIAEVGRSVYPATQRSAAKRLGRQFVRQTCG